MVRISMKLSLAAVVLAGCSNLSPYTGPTGHVTLEGVERVWPHGMDNTLSRETVIYITNPNFEAYEAVLDCSPHGHGHQSRNWMGSRLTVYVPPRTVYSVLLHPRDHNCELQPVVSD